jgi:tRNA(Ile)-lysidine synthase
VPLAKLEAIVDALRSSDPAGTAKWTLARVMITAKGGAVIIEREPGRDPLSRLTMAPGEKALWDGRFRIDISPDFAGGPVEVRALGEAEAGLLLRQDADASRVPAGIAAMVPCFRSGDRLIAVPPLNHWPNPCCRSHLKAEFTGMSTLVRASAWLTGAGELETS